MATGKVWTRPKQYVATGWQGGALPKPQDQEDGLSYGVQGPTRTREQVSVEASAANQAAKANAPADEMDIAQLWANSPLGEEDNKIDERSKNQLAQANAAYGYQVSDMARVANEMNAINGGSAFGGGAQLGAAQAALRAGQGYADIAQKSQGMNMQAHAQNTQNKITLLQTAIQKALDEGRMDLARELQANSDQLQLLMQQQEFDYDTSFNEQQAKAAAEANKGAKKQQVSAAKRIGGYIINPASAAIDMFNSW
jgi:hypothetical protein